MLLFAAELSSPTPFRHSTLAMALRAGTKSPGSSPRLRRCGNHLRLAAHRGALERAHEADGRDAAWDLRKSEEVSLSLRRAKRRAVQWLFCMFLPGGSHAEPARA